MGPYSDSLVGRFGSVLLFSVPATLTSVSKDHQQLETSFQNFSTMKRLKRPKYVPAGLSLLATI